MLADNSLPDLPLLRHLPQTAPEPARKIFSEDDLEIWTKSRAYKDLDSFITRCSAAAEENHKKGETESSKGVKAITDWLEHIEGLVEEELDAGLDSKDGLREWLAKVDASATALHHHLIPPSQAVALPELSFHLLSSFGSPIRFDYGTGHELHFVIYLLILRLIGVLEPEDERSMVASVCAGYARLVRKLQKVFKLEAAGKMGVWGLDEHQRLVYQWGASAARGRPIAKPASVLAPPQFQLSQGSSHVFLASILHVDPKARRRAPADATTPSSSSSSLQAEEAPDLLRLYRTFVLHCLPAIQHLRFGPIFSWTSSTTGEALASSADDLDLDSDEVARQALLDSLDKRETSEGTVAPWAIPTLSGVRRPREVLEKLPPSSGRANGSVRAPSSVSGGSPPGGSPPGGGSPPPGGSPPASPESSPGGSPNGSPYPRPYAETSPRLRTASRLSISETFPGEAHA
ncbi:SPOSA6832_03228, partial [Sporobolomyces salmonicolor]